MPVIEPSYPKGSEAGGQPPIPLERMLRVYFLQLWLNLPDPAVEEALYDSAAMRSFAGIDLGSERAPDETTVCKFRRLLEHNGLCKKPLATVNEHLKRSGIKITSGTIMDATIISAPTWTKNQDAKRDHSMHKTATGKQCHFEMKGHSGVDSRTKLIHTVLASATNEADFHALPHLLHGKETRIWCDQAYRGHTTDVQAAAPYALDLTKQRYRSGAPIDEAVKAKNRAKSRIRAKVERVSGVIKRVFALQKVCYRRLAKNLHRLEVTAAPANLFMVRSRLLRS